MNKKNDPLITVLATLSFTIDAVFFLLGAALIWMGIKRPDVALAIIGAGCVVFGIGLLLADLRVRFPKLFAALLLCVFALNFSARAQWYGYLQLTGTNYATAAVSGVLTTNFAPVTLPQRSLIVTNINTNEAIYVAYGYQPAGQAATNPAVISGFWTNFPASNGWLPGMTWIYPIPPINAQVPIVPWATFAISNGQFTSQSCTNGVLTIP